jgi:20S proteasome alpha/beta subunit
MHFEIIGSITDVETIAAGGSIRILPVLRKQYGSGYWRKLKGIATVRLADRTMRLAGVHWFEAHGIGKRKMRIKRFLD